jgi:hypothetical protein
MWEKSITTTATFYKKVTSSTLNDELKARAVSFSTSWIQSARGWSNTNNHTNRP